MWNWSSKNTRYLGIDIGTSTLKVVELEGKREGAVLVNYASCYSPIRGKEGVENKEGFLRLSSSDLEGVIEGLVDEVGIKADRAAISVPIYSTFTTLIDLPSDLADKNTEEAVQFKAKKHVPVELSKVVLEWHFIDGANKKKKLGTEAEKKNRKVFVVAIPKEIVEKYRKMSSLLSGLDIELLEIEIFSLARMINGIESEDVVLIDIGGKNTNATLVRGGTIVNTLNVNISGEDLTRALMSSKKISFEQASKLKKKKGLKSKDTRDTIEPLLEDILMRIKRRLFANLDTKPQVVLSGGSAKLSGFRSYVEETLGSDVSIIDPWKNINSPEKLKKRLKNLAPSYAVACGLALRGLD